MADAQGPALCWALDVLAFCPWPQRASAAKLNTAWRSAMGLNPHPSAETDQSADLQSYWYFLCERLAEESLIYVPLPSNPCGIYNNSPPPGVASCWQQLFKELYSMVRSTKSEDSHIADTSAQRETFKIDAAARFRPAQSLEISDEKGVVLPLHQKVQLVRGELGCSSKTALSLIMRSRGMGGQGPTSVTELPADIFQPCFCPGVDSTENNVVEEDQDDPKAKEFPESSISNSISEHSIDARCSIVSIREDTASVLAITRQSGLREFGFDRVFSETATQINVYELSVRRLLMEFLNGTNASIICYGQTASGKTHTMFGPPSSAPTVVSEAYRGLVPRACAEILNAIHCWKLQGIQVRLGVSYVELFGNEVSDLLHEGRIVGQGLDGRYDAVRSTDRVGHRYVLDGHTEWPVGSLKEIDEYLLIGDEAKRRAATAMNERSTRAHTVFILSLAVHERSQTEGVNAQVRRSRFYFADLGGSEQLSKSKVDVGTKAPVTVVGGVEQSRLNWQEYYSHRQRIQETIHINKGLFCLKKVIETLQMRSRLAGEGIPQHRLPYVPYQDSKLTMLLQDALGGSARTLVIATATMDVNHATESFQTLRFVETCSQIQNRRNAVEAASLQNALGSVAEEIAHLQAEIAKKERWETQVVQRPDVDTVAGAFGNSEGKVQRDEIVKRSVMVGAEAERERLEQLLQRQAELQGLGNLGEFGKDYRNMAVIATEDGGKGVDFRERERFSARMKAKDFEDEAVLADAIRFLFRKASGAHGAFGETEWTIKQRLPRDQIPTGYFAVAQSLRRTWENETAAGKESRPFGKSMMDRCQAWAATFKADAGSRDSTLCTLLEACGIPANGASDNDM